jgi:N-acetylglutamate synthase-like GNAT family acetyltransferase
MNSSHYRVRRATLDDIGALRTLWSPMGFAVDDLEKHLTEFQVAEDAAGQIVGACGFRTHQRHGLIHSEACADFSVVDEVRPLFWQRVQTLAMNHGIARLWTHERAPFWEHTGFQPATHDALQNLPPAWAAAPPDWLTLPLKNENAIASLEKEMAMLMHAEKQRTANRLESAKTLKTVVTFIGFLVAFAILGAAAYLYLSRHQISPLPQ